MKIPRIIDAMEHVDDKYILEAAESGGKKKSFGWMKFVAVLAACVCLVAFSYTLFDSKDYLVDYDVDPSYMLPGVMLASAGDDYFGIIPTQRGFRLMSYDENTEIATEVCAVEGCDHTDSRICTALQWPFYTGVSVYDGRVYWAAMNKEDLSQISIMSSLYDGSDYQVLKSVPSDVLYAYNAQTYVRAHRGYMYFAGLIEGANDSNVRITAEELTEDGESFTVFETTEGNVGYDWSMQIYANTMYIYLPTFEIKSEGKVVWTDIVYSYDIQNRKLKKLYSGQIDSASQNCWIDKDENLYYVSYNDENECYALCKLNLKNGKTKTVFDISEIDANEYRYLQVMSGIVTAVTPYDDHVFVKHFDGTSVTLDFSDIANYLSENYEGFFSRRFIGADDKYVFFNCCDDENIMAVPLDGSEPKLIFSRVTADPNWGYWFNE